MRSATSRWCAAAAGPACRVRRRFAPSSHTLSSHVAMLRRDAAFYRRKEKQMARRVVQAPTLVTLDRISMIRPSDWMILRNLRLAALENDWGAFLATNESAWDEERWKKECATSSWFHAVLHGQPVGLVKIAEYPAEDPPYHLESMWVTKDHRGHGIGRTLVEHSESFVRERGGTALGLWVFAGNSAQRFYESLGYEHGPQGRRQPIMHYFGRDDDRVEIELTKQLR
jgi:GNAT superfamily N-acetyltransferase